MDELIKQISEFDSKLAKIIDSVVVSLKDDLMSELETASGTIINSKKNQDYIIGITKTIRDELKNGGLFKLYRDEAKNNLELRKVQELEIANRLDFDVDFGRIDYSTLNGLSNMQTNYLSELTEQQVLNIAKGLNANVLFGVKFNDALSMITKDLTILENRASTYLQTAKRNYLQATEDKVVESFRINNDDKVWEYVGSPLQSNSHPECKKAVPKRFFSNKEKEDFESGKFGSMRFDPARWNCQHNFILSIKTFKKGERKNG